MTKRDVFVAISAVFVLAGALLFSSQSLGQRARANEGGAAALRDGPGGMWVLQGNKIYVCTSGMIAQGNSPPAPRCGPATILIP
ncbi:MAG: hypothetical protein IPJ88_02215 [Myxococcales bacterium]|nr:MAG: hypothetical protein IPJ88_02215 [Myxococcales bacterium]